MKRKSLNTSIQTRHFQSGSGMLNYTGGTYSHGGMMHFPRIPITEWNFGKFPDSMEFQSWKVNFRTEACLRTADPQITVLWNKEVESAKLIDECLTSRSITGQHNFPDFGVLDAMIGSALKKVLNTQSTFRKRVAVEEQRAQKDDRFFRGRQVAYMIYEYFRATGASEVEQGLSDLFNIRVQNDDVHDFDVRWDQALLSASDMPSDVILEGLYKSKLKDFVQLQTVLALYNQETVRNSELTSYLRLKTSVRLQIDQIVKKERKPTSCNSTNKLPTPHSFLCWEMRFKNQVTT